VKDALLQELEEFLRREDFGTNWDGAYQDVIPTIRRYFDSHGFETRLLSESESPSRDAELVARREHTTVHVPWDEDRNGRSVVHLNTIQIRQSLGDV
jgi:hypothetical protein